MREKIIARLAILSIIALFLGLRIYSWNAAALAGNSMPMPFGYGMSIVLSGSMEPVLSVNDLVFIKDTRDVEIGDIIVYEKDDEMIIHRITDKDGNTIITQGDANNAADNPVELYSVKGKMIAHIPGVGIFVRAIKSRVGTILLLFIALLLVELSYRHDMDDVEIKNIKAEIRQLKEEKKEVITRE